MGRSDSPLTPDGITVAKQVAWLVEQQKIRTVFSSPLGRARLSAEIYTEGTGLPILATETMAELSCGEWEAKSRYEVLEGEELIRKTWLDRPPGGESYSDAETRVARLIQEITSQDIQYPVSGGRSCRSEQSIPEVMVELGSGVRYQDQLPP